MLKFVKRRNQKLNGDDKDDENSVKLYKHYIIDMPHAYTFGHTTATSN